MRHLLSETRAALEAHGKTEADVRWVGGNDFAIPWELFRDLADAEYDSGYGSAKVATDLIVAGDGWWLTRAEYDGSEWWEYHTQPVKPRAEVVTGVVRVVLDSAYEAAWTKVDYDTRMRENGYYVGWVSLAEMNGLADDGSAPPALPAPSLVAATVVEVDVEDADVVEMGDAADVQG